ncbi:hypothetical protein SeLEV6574_g02506 [Synchytrium endobioticum]|nr:hypothetical protein SeLEV6574_g02506 [Synchytrium endobioticum]
MATKNGGIVAKVLFETAEAADAAWHYIQTKQRPCRLEWPSDGKDFDPYRDDEPFLLPLRADPSLRVEMVLPSTLPPQELISLLHHCWSDYITRCDDDGLMSRRRRFTVVFSKIEAASACVYTLNRLTMVTASFVKNAEEAPSLTYIIDGGLRVLLTSASKKFIASLTKFGYLAKPHELGVQIQLKQAEFKGFDALGRAVKWAPVVSGFWPVPRCMLLKSNDTSHHNDVIYHYIEPSTTVQSDPRLQQSQPVCMPYSRVHQQDLQVLSSQVVAHQREAFPVSLSLQQPTARYYAFTASPSNILYIWNLPRNHPIVDIYKPYEPERLDVRTSQIGERDTYAFITFKTVEEVQDIVSSLAGKLKVDERYIYVWYGELLTGSCDRDDWKEVKSEGASELRGTGTGY